MKLQIILTQALLAQAHVPLDTSPSLAALLGMGSRQFVSDSAESLLCQAAAVTKQADWPIAAISNAADALNVAATLNLAETRARPPYWLYVDFVHFVLQRDYFTLAEVLSLSPHEAELAITSLNQHFAGMGMVFRCRADGRCYVQLQDDPHISTTQPQQVLGLETTHYMPQGAGAPKWNRLLNEMQMLLHEHAVNQLREQRGELAANSIWLSGGGVLPVGSTSPQALKIIGNSHLCQGLQAINQQLHTAGSYEIDASGAGINNAQALLQAQASDACLLLDDAELLMQPETDWFKPLLQALRTRQLRELTLHFALGRRTLSVHVTSVNAWAFWRRPKALSSLAPELAAPY